MSVYLVLGGARSGKSAYAEKLAQQMSAEQGAQVIYVATAQVYDDEFKARVAHHQASRPHSWHLVETPHRLAQTLQSIALEPAWLLAPRPVVIVDCLTLWLAQCICPECAPPEGINWEQECAQFLETLPTLPYDLILVSNEVGMGIVPLGEINRRFQDAQGRLNQAVAKLANNVTFVAAGLPLQLKGTICNLN